MKRFFKFAWPFIILFIALDIFVIVITTNKSGYQLTMPGGINPVEATIQIEDAPKLKGSFNTVYVYSYNHITTFQASILGFGNENTPEIGVSTVSKLYDITDAENYQSGIIQKNQSIETSLIIAYQTAKEHGYDVNLDYEFLGFIVYLYAINQEHLRIGDIITKVIRKSGAQFGLDKPSNLANALNTIEVGDTIIYQRDNEEFEYLVDKEISYSEKTSFWAYRKYQINEETAKPSFNLESANTQGPSGGFLQTLSTYCQITGVDLTGGKRIAGTGTIEINGGVGPIGGIEQKIVTAIRNNCDIFLCSEYHYEDALNAYNKTLGHDKMKLISIPYLENSAYYASFSEAVHILEELLNE